MSRCIFVHDCEVRFQRGFSPRVVPRPVSQTAAQPPAFTALGMRSSAGPDYAAIDFPVLEDSAAEDDGLLPLWAIALGSVVSVGFGVVRRGPIAHDVPRDGRRHSPNVRLLTRRQTTNL
jgi:hypothetical protein